MFNLTNIFHFQTTTNASSSQNDDFQKEAIVDETIYPRRSGRVYFKATWWPARCKENVTLEVGDTVYVVGIYNITLLVEPAPFE